MKIISKILFLTFALSLNAMAATWGGYGRDSVGGSYENAMPRAYEDGYYRYVSCNYYGCWHYDFFGRYHYHSRSAAAPSSIAQVNAAINVDTLKNILGYTDSEVAEIIEGQAKFQAELEKNGGNLAAINISQFPQAWQKFMKDSMGAQ